MRIGRHLKAWRELQKKTRTEAAKEVGISQGTWSDLEADKVDPKLETFQQLHRAGVLPTELVLELLGGKDSDSLDATGKSSDAA
jgi:transcriptional regulator with XRE-family HTH domain